MRSCTFDLIQALYGIGVLLLIFGVIPFTAAGVGILLAVGTAEAKFTWSQ